MATDKQTRAQELCAGVKPDLRELAETLANAVLAMQEKIEKEIPAYKEAPLAQVLTTTQGEPALKQNPAVQEFRATVRDYAAALNNLQDILSENKAPTQISDMAELRKKFKIAK
jgi:hypothetical protein